MRIIYKRNNMKLFDKLHIITGLVSQFCEFIKHLPL